MSKVVLKQSADALDTIQLLYFWLRDNHVPVTVDSNGFSYHLTADQRVSLSDELYQMVSQIEELAIRLAQMPEEPVELELS